MLKIAYMKKVDALLKEADRMDLWGHCFEKDKPEDPADLVETLIQQYPEKKVKVEKYHPRENRQVL